MLYKNISKFSRKKASFKIQKGTIKSQETRPAIFILFSWRPWHCVAVALSTFETITSTTAVHHSYSAVSIVSIRMATIQNNLQHNREKVQQRGRASYSSSSDSNAVANTKQPLAAGFDYAVQADGTILAERRWRELRRTAHTCFTFAKIEQVPDRRLYQQQQQRGQSQHQQVPSRQILYRTRTSQSDHFCFFATASSTTTTSTATTK
jgi:hypothetical protein